MQRRGRSHLAAEIVDGALQPEAQRHLRRPAGQLAHERDVGAPPPRVVVRDRPMLDRRLGARHLGHHPREIPDREFLGIADVHGARHVVGRLHHGDHGVHQIVHVAEGARLLALAVDRDRLSAERLGDEVRHHAAVVRLHPRPVGVEDANDLDPQVVLAAVVEEQRLAHALGLVVAGPWAQHVDVAAIILALGVLVGVAVDLGRGRLQDLGARALGEPQHVDRPQHARLRGLDRIVLVLARARRTGEVVDLVYLDIHRKGHVVAQRLEVGAADQVGDVALAAREVVVHAQHVVPLRHQPVAQMAAQEAGPARDQDASLVHEDPSKPGRPATPRSVRDLSQPDLPQRYRHPHARPDPGGGRPADGELVPDKRAPAVRSK